MKQKKELLNLKINGIMAYNGIIGGIMAYNGIMGSIIANNGIMASNGDHA